MNRFCNNAIAYIKYDARDSQLSGAKITVNDFDNEPVIRDLGNGLHVVYVVDREDGLFYVHRHHLKAEGLSEDQLHEIGVRNLQTHVAEQLKVHKRSAIFTTLVDGNFEASLVLIDDLWDKSLKSLIPNEVVIAMPERSVLAFCDSLSTEGISTLKEVVRRVYENGEHPLSPYLFIRRNGAWLPLQE